MLGVTVLLALGGPAVAQDEEPEAPAEPEEQAEQAEPEAPPEEAPPEEAAAPEAPEEGPHSFPVKGAPNPKLVREFGQAKPLTLNAVTDIGPLKASHWFKVAVDTDEPVVLRVGGLNTWGLAVSVFDDKGAQFSEGFSRSGRTSGWHGRVTAGTYYIRLAGEPNAPERTDEDEQEARKNAKLPPATELGTRPAIQVYVDAIGPGATPRRAAQLGLNFLQIDSPAWQNSQRCNGCHVQSQALMGFAVAKKNGYRVEARPALALGEFMTAQEATGTAELFGLLAIRYHTGGFAPERKAVLLERAKALIAYAAANGGYDGGDQLPIEAGEISGNSMAVQILSQALRFASKAERAGLEKARAGALALLKKKPSESVQDHALKIIAYVEAEEPASLIASERAALLRWQNKDGGFAEAGQPRDSSNAYGTGQALYALRLAGMATDEPAFTKAVKWLVTHQAWNGTWPLENTTCQSDISHAMWAVIGLAGSLQATLPVRVSAVVRDAKGGFVTDLKAADFTLGEDGATQEVIEFRKLTGDQSIVLVLDTSGSIKRALPTVVKAAGSFLDVLSPGDQVALEEFNSKPFPPGAFTKDRAALRGQLAGLKARGGTALYDAIGTALDHLRDRPEPRAIVMLTDGRDEDASGKKAGSRLRLGDIQARLKETGIPLYILGLGDGVEAEVLRKLAGASGGRAYIAPKPQDVEAIYRELAGSLRAQYVLKYNSSKPTADGKWRAIQVGVKRPGVKVEATSGYTATSGLLQ
jgi:VWFA-related protein